MKINIKPGIFVGSNEPELRLDARMYGIYYPSNIFFDRKETIMCSILRQLQSFHNQLKGARTNLGLNKLLDYPSQPTIDNLSKLPYENFNSDQIEILNEDVKSIRQKYVLGDNWKLSISSAILTHCLPIPPGQSKIMYYIPRPPEQEKKATNLRDLSKIFEDELKTSNPIENAMSLVSRIEVIKYPAIYFSARVNPTELRTWIKNNKAFFDSINKNFPNESKVASRFKSRTDKVGAVAVLLSRGGVKTWSAMRDRLDEWEKDDPGTDDFWGKEGSPTADELRTSFKSYMEIVEKIENKQTESK